MAARLGTAFQQWLGIEWILAESGDDVHVELELRPDLRGPVGSLEGGVVSTMIDVAGASVAARAAGKMVATQSLAISLLAPGRVGPIRATGSILRLGKTDAVSHVDVVDLGNDSRLIAVGTVTLRLLEPRP